jgi:parallel beta-helix repeat protein
VSRDRATIEARRQGRSWPRKARRSPATARLPRSWLLLPATALLVTVALLGFPGARSAGAAACGGAVPCSCGDRVVVDTVLTSDIGPCVWGGNPSELVGIRIDSNVTLDCDHHSIIGPADARKEEFGVKFGSASRPVDSATLRNCDIAGFWWGVHVAASTNITVEGNSLHDNGWEDPEANGTGYGIDIAGIATGVEGNRVIVRQNEIRNNGNEGVHLSSSSGVELIGNVIEDNGKEQLYVLRSDRNEVHDNLVRGGTQGLEVRESRQNSFSYNRWLGAPLHLLETNSDGNVFVYDDFEGSLHVGRGSVANEFRYARLENPTGTCADVDGDATRFQQAWFANCREVVSVSVPTTFDRSVGLPPGSIRRPLIAIHKGCNADLDADGVVTAADESAIAEALGSAPGSATWNPAADLDRDRTVGPNDLRVAAWQRGRCPERNVRALPQMKPIVIRDRPNGQPDDVDLVTAGSRDRDGRIVRHEIKIVSRLTGALVASADLIDVTASAAHLQDTFPPGVYLATLTVTDNYWERSRTIKRNFRVR